MATIKCPTCGYSESDGRPHDREVYPEMCVRCTRAMCNGVRELRIADAFTPPNPFGQCCDSASATGGAYHAPDCHSVKA